MDNIYSITLANGIVIENLKLNGSNYVSVVEIKESYFAANCSPVIIFDGLTNDVHEHMELIQITKFDNEWWIALRDISPTELAQQKMRADVDYLAMMTDTEL